MKIKQVEYSYTYKKLKDLHIDDYVVGPDGEKFPIRQIHKNGIMDVYRITLSDGTMFRTSDSHFNTVHFRMSHVRTDKKVYDTLTTKYIREHLDSYLFEIPTDKTFSWRGLDFIQFVEMLPLHEYEPIEQEHIIPNTTKDPNKVYIESIERIGQEENWCLALGYPWGLYLTEDGIITHNSLLTNLCMSYIITHFCLMREPYKILGHSQPIYENSQLPDGKYTTLGDLKVGQQIAGVSKKTTIVEHIFEQGLKETYRLTFDDNTTCECSMDHLWTVYDELEKQFTVLSTKDIQLDLDRYLFPDMQDCIQHQDDILLAEKRFQLSKSWLSNLPDLQP